MSSSRTSPLRNKESETTGKGYERARAILEATRTIFANDGYAGLSMRAVATKVGVNLSTVQHYYPSKDNLIEALLSQTLQDYQAAVDLFTPSGSQSSNLDQHQFEALIDYFLDDISTPESSGMLSELWALAYRHTFAADILDQMLTRSRKVFRNLIRNRMPTLAPEQCELRGALMVAQLQGLTLYLATSRPQHKELTGLKTAARAAIVHLAFAPEINPDT